MDPELLLQLIQETLASPQGDRPDPRMEAEALFLQRLQDMPQDATAPDAFMGGGESNIIGRASQFTPFGDVGNLLNAIEERDPLAIGGAALLALLGTAGAAGIGSRLFRGSRALRAGEDIVEESGEGIGALRRELRERRSGEAGRRGAPREGPRGRRASDAPSDQLMREVEGIIARDILQQAARSTSGQVDPVTELIRLLERGGN